MPSSAELRVTLSYSMLRLVTERRRTVCGYTGICPIQRSRMVLLPATIIGFESSPG